jgi:16S rRNA (uracil1498-N3)-methyltransferase
VKRLAVGDPVRLTSGDGRRSRATITELSRRRLVVSTIGETLEELPPLPPVELWAPVGDRERMLWLAEKATELGVTAWRAIVYRRSRSVSPRGEGDPFREKVRARMISALEQSGGAWLPAILPDATLDDMLDDAALATSDPPRISGRLAGALVGVLLDAAGDPIAPLLSRLAGRDTPPALRLALGPEGGLDPDERDRFLRAGWHPAAFGPNVLRFETAGIAALAVVRSQPW